MLPAVRLDDCDALSIHLLLSGRTRGIVRARELSLMKLTAYLLNTSREEIVEEAAPLEVRGKRGSPAPQLTCMA